MSAPVLESVLAELRAVLQAVPEDALQALVDRIAGAQRIFVAGSGRSGFMVRAFAMRLMHLGLAACVAGETTTPGIRAGDLLILGSGSGETGSLRSMAEKAARAGVPIALLTASPQSSLGRTADLVVRLPAPTPKSDQLQGLTSVQPMGTLFEQSLLLLLDLVVLRLMERLGVDAQAMFARHANLE